MTNESFSLLSEEGKTEKLKKVLMEKSENCLDEEEMQIIMNHISLNRQYVIRTYFEPSQFIVALAASDSFESQTLLGSMVAGTVSFCVPVFDTQHTAAIVTRADQNGKIQYCIHLYIPSSRIQRRNHL